MSSMIKNLGKKGVFIDYGPVTAVISIIKDNANLKELEFGSFEIIKDILKELSCYKEILKLKAANLTTFRKKVPMVVKKAVEASNFINGSELSPMSAIAGAVGETVTEKLCNNTKIHRIIINNGGDISIFCKNRKYLPSIAMINFRGKIVSTEVGGIATSGLKGRSMTKGIADAVTVFAKSASIADAAATLIANNVTVKSEKIVYEFAEKFDKDSDLKGEKITTYVGKLSEDEIKNALLKGLKFTEKKLRVLLKKEF